MKLSFVIPAYNEEHYVGACLDAILAERGNLSPAIAATIEVVIVDNASTDGTAKVVEKYVATNANVKLVHEPQKGITHARRAGFLASSSELIANIDADTRITPGWLSRVLAEFDRNPKLAALSGPFIYYDAPRKIRIFTRVYYYLGYIIFYLIGGLLGLGSMIQGGNFVVRRTALEKIGGYDTNILFYGEDADIARRMSKVGRVKFLFNLPALSSSRRLAKEGGLTIGLRYGINILWIFLFKKPYSGNYLDVRPKETNDTTYAPQNKAKEWIIGTLFILIICAILFGIAYIIYRFIF